MRSAPPSQSNHKWDAFCPQYWINYVISLSTGILRRLSLSVESSTRPQLLADATHLAGIESRRNRCDEMCALCLSATVSLLAVSTNLQQLANASCARQSRRRRQVHNHHVSHKGVFYLQCVSTPCHWRCSGLTTLLQPQVQHIVPEVTIPPEVTPEKVTTYIVDTGCQSSQRAYMPRLTS